MDRGEVILLVYLVVCAGAAGYIVGQRVAAARIASAGLQSRLWELEAKERERALRPAGKPKEAAA